MPMINLLPWREELRQKRKKEFLTAAFAAVLMSAAITFGTKVYYGSMIDSQESRNDLLRAEIAKLKELNSDIEDLKAQKDSLLERTRVIEELERSTPEAVALVDSLVDIMPPGAYLTEISQEGTRVDLTGIAQSSGRVTGLMRNINNSAWLTGQGLKDLVTRGTGAASEGEFSVWATQIGLAESEEGQP